MKLQSFSNFALNNKQMDATKGGKRVTTSASIQQMITAAVASGATAKKATPGQTLTTSNCSVSKTTMVGSICIEWKNGPGCTSTTPTTPTTGA